MLSIYDLFIVFDNVVDGDKIDLFYIGGQCVILVVGYKIVWWWVDFGDLSSIINIIIYYRIDNVVWGKLNKVLDLKFRFKD